ncbi:hypothetical protein ACP275_06G198800 [Erythranthe tilingii]
MESKKIIRLNILVCFLVIATFCGDVRVEGKGFIIITTPTPCGDELCDYLCKKEGCGGHYCIGGKCIQDPRFKDGPVCYCRDIGE